ARTPAAPDPRPEVTGLFIQAGAFSKADEAEQQRARLAMLGFAARISEREQGGRPVFRVRVGPYETRDETQGPMDRLQAAGIEVSLVRVERSATP
ncbi:MAG: SPOR domain-containing protein, partial [Betaproteobacteria bacterium]